MRFAVICLGLCGVLLLGAPCVPLLQDPTPDMAPAKTLGVAIRLPAADRTVAVGTVVPISWNAFNNTGESASATLYIESRVDLSQTVLAENVPIVGTYSNTARWDTAGFAAGEYVIYALITGRQTASATGPGRITIDHPPAFEFTQPTENKTVRPPIALTIAWTGSDLEGAGRFTIGLDLNTDHNSGDELFIHEGTVRKDPTDGTFNWTGNTLTADPVDSGTYYLFALLNDDVNQEVSVTSEFTVTVDREEAEPPPTPIRLGIAKPEEDTSFLTTDPPLHIEFTVNEFSDVLIDLKIDTDDNHRNGNELTILSQRLVAGGTERDTFDWDGTLSDGGQAPETIYRLFIVMNSGTGSPTLADGPGLIQRRSDANQPLIAMLEPGTVREVNPGDYVAITWRDDDPTEAATIRLTINSAEGPEIMTILTGRSAVADGSVHDSFLWQVPASLGPGTYRVHGHILTDDSTVVRNHSISPGRLIIKDPAQP